MKSRGIPEVFDSDGEGSDPGRVLGLHLFADAVERIDTILQEIRHLQSNLIYTLRFPELNRALQKPSVTPSRTHAGPAPLR